MKVAIVWDNFGPYHRTRLKAASDLLGEKNVVGIEFSKRSQIYAWQADDNSSGRIVTLFENIAVERFFLLKLSYRFRRVLVSEKPDVCFVPSYWPASSAAILLVAKWSGCHCVMMNETHGGTTQSAGLKNLVKKALLKLFDAALIGGQPQREYFTGLGIPPERIFDGYDVVDNDYFREKAEMLKTEIVKSETRKQYELPEHYFLSLGRFVAKKNLGTLIHAYRKYLDATPAAETHLVMVGSGEEETKLRALCNELRLPVYDKRSVRKAESCENRAPRNEQRAAGTTLRPRTSVPNSDLGPRTSDLGDAPPGVHFYGFRQLEENPVFYALADAFILPSLWEEWGLVVNEAMACGLPVIVSQTAGCARDLVKNGVNGFTFGPTNQVQLASLLLRISDSDFPLSDFGLASERIIAHWGPKRFASGLKEAVAAARTTED